MAREITREQFLQDPARWVRESQSEHVRVMRRNGTVAMELTGSLVTWEGDGSELAHTAFQAAMAIHDEAEEMARRGVM